jgi:predicted cobalt transporter CbtA
MEARRRNTAGNHVPDQEVVDMKKIACLVALGALLALASACGKNKMVEVAENYEKEACACKDAACATAATTKFSEETSKNAASMPKSGGDAEAYTKAASAAAQCVTKAAMSGVPGMPPMPGAPPKK